MARAEWITVKGDTALGIPDGTYYAGTDGIIMSNIWPKPDISPVH